MMAPSTSIIRITGRAMLAMREPSAIDAAMNCETSSRAMEDIGHIAQPVQTAWRQLVPLPKLAPTTPSTLARKRVNTTAATIPATAGFQSALAATTDTSTNIIIVSSDAAVPIWRVQDQGRGCICLSIRPPISPASGAEPPKCAASAVPAAISEISRIEVFSLLGLMKRSAERSARASSAPTTKEMPSTTPTG